MRPCAAILAPAAFASLAAEQPLFSAYPLWGAQESIEHYAHQAPFAKHGPHGA
jgi:hypothetical protein